MQKTTAEQVAWEFHRWQGFTRFRAGKDGKLMARIAPAFDILAQLAAYFAPRLLGRSWVLIDDKRGCAAFGSTTGNWSLRNWQQSAEPCVADEVEGLWQTYFDTIEIRERHNTALQKKPVPVRYRPYLTEYNS